MSELELPDRTNFLNWAFVKSGKPAAAAGGSFRVRIRGLRRIWAPARRRAPAARTGPAAARAHAHSRIRWRQQRRRQQRQGAALQLLTTRKNKCLLCLASAIEGPGKCKHPAGMLCRQTPGACPEFSLCASLGNDLADCM